PIPEGYKIFALCEAGYTYWFMWSSKKEKIGELIRIDGLTDTGSMVFQLAGQLSKQQSHVIYLDNYFTSVPLFNKLRNEDIGACGTTRKHKEFPGFLAELKDTCSGKMEWNTLAAIEVDEVLCLAWQDNNTVLALSTVHTVDEANKIIRKRRCP